MAQLHSYIIFQKIKKTIYDLLRLSNAYSGTYLNLHIKTYCIICIFIYRLHMILLIKQFIIIKKLIFI